MESKFEILQAEGIKAIQNLLDSNNSPHVASVSWPRLTQRDLSIYRLGDLKDVLINDGLVDILVASLTKAKGAAAQLGLFKAIESLADAGKLSLPTLVLKS